MAGVFGVAPGTPQGHYARMDSASAPSSRRLGAFVASPVLLRAIAAAATLLLAGTGGAEAQGGGAHSPDRPVVTGEVHDLQTRRPLANVAVRLVTEDGTQVLGSAWTDANGRYTVLLFLGEREDPGSLVIQAGTLGYVLSSSDPFRLSPGRVTTVPRIQLRPEPVVLDSVVAEAAPLRWNELRPPRERVRQRQLEGRGTFIPGAVVENSDARSLPEFVADRIDGLEVEFPAEGPTLRSTFYPRCLHVLVNEWPARDAFAPHSVRGREVGAIEV